MQALLVVAHPASNSFSHAIADVVERALTRRGYDVRLRDLYAERFPAVRMTGEDGPDGLEDPLIAAHSQDLIAADQIVICHPNWWGQPPAILKGWVDRVFRLGVAYTYRPGEGPEGLPVGLLRARRALVFNTSNTPSEREASVFGDPLQILWERCVFGFCGLENVQRLWFGPMANSTAEQRASWLEQVERLASREP